MNKKPLGRKSYGSIPHLCGSKLGPGDHTISVGQHRIATQTCATNNKGCKRRIFIQEKLDGSNVGIAKINNEIVPITRAGYCADSSPFNMHHKFAKWVSKNESKFRDLLDEGERLCGEWLYQAHGLLYSLPHEPFVAFDIFNKDNERLNYTDFKDRIEPFEIVTPNLIASGPIAPQELMDVLRITGSKHGCNSVPEGIVYRVEVETKSKSGVYKPDFLCKFVRHTFEPGVYLNGVPVINEYVGEKL